MLPQIVSSDDGLGFRWAHAEGTPTRLAELIRLPEAEPTRWLATHLEVLDELLIEVASRYGEVMGGGRGARPGEHDHLRRAYVEIDRAIDEYAQARDLVWGPGDVRAGQILGTAALMSIRLRDALGLLGPAPFDGELDEPTPGVVGGYAGLVAVDPAAPWRGGRWLVTTTDGRRLPASLSMLLRDSSGVDREATLQEHAEALSSLVQAIGPAVADPMVASGALDWLIFDWVMAHRSSTESGAVEIPAARTADAAVLVAAAAASVRVRQTFDPALVFA